MLLQAHHVARMFFAALELTPQADAAAAPAATTSISQPGTPNVLNQPPSSHEHICCDAFVTVAQQNGLGNWRIDASSVVAPAMAAAKGSSIGGSTTHTAGQGSMGHSAHSRGYGSPASSSLVSSPHNIQRGRAGIGSSNGSLSTSARVAHGASALESSSSHAWRLPEGNEAEGPLAGAVRSKMMVALERWGVVVRCLTFVSSPSCAFLQCMSAPMMFHGSVQGAKYMLTKRYILPAKVMSAEIRACGQPKQVSIRCCGSCECLPNLTCAAVCCSTLVAMEPSLEAQLSQLRSMLHGTEELLRIEERAAHLAAKMQPQEGGRVDAAGAWLAYRLLIAAMEGHVGR